MSADQPGGIQLIPEYKNKLDPKFLDYYLANFKNTRCGYCHTPVCSLHGDFQEYHIVIAEDSNNQPMVYKNESTTVDLHDHTFARNENSWAMSIDGWAGDSPKEFTEYIPTKGMIQLAISTFADECINMKVPVGNLMTHTEAADERDGYNQYEGKYGPENGCTRWDWHCLINPETFALKPAYDGDKVLWAGSNGWVYFGDFLRGEVILQIQEKTKFKWKK